MPNILLIRKLAACVSLCLVSSVCYGEPQRGQALHDEDCRVCHDSSVYTRENRKVQTLKKLAAQVDRCQQGVGVEWDATQLDAVTTYLNKRFYRFSSGTD